MMNYLEILKIAGEHSEDYDQQIHILSNCSSFKHENVLKWSLSKSRLNISVKSGSFDSIVSDSFGLEGSNAQVLIHYDFLAYFYGRALNFVTSSDELIDEICDNIINELDLVFKNLHDSRDIFVVPFSCFGQTQIHRDSSYYLNKLNEFLFQSSRKYSNIVVVNPIFSNDDWVVKEYLRSKSPHSLAFLERVCSEVSLKCLKNDGKVKKVLVFDCDNTLWGGVIGESEFGSHVKYASEDKIGFIFHNVHLLINSLRQYGILIGIITKNNSSDLKLFLEKNTLTLDFNYVVSIKANWQDKHVNLVEMANELNLGIDSFCFVDDSDFEIEMMRNFLPQVSCFQVPKKVDNYFNDLLSFIKSNFVLNIDHGAEQRIATYKGNISREALKATHLSKEDFIKELNIKVKHDINDLSNLSRIEELYLKTNQFNLVTERLTKAEILSCLSGNDDIHTFSISDKFGNFGITALVHCSFRDESVVVRNFIMSCRVMGRNIELDILSIIENHYYGRYKFIESTYVKSAKNSTVESLYDGCNYEKIYSDKDMRKYIKNLINKAEIKYLTYESY